MILPSLSYLFKGTYTLLLGRKLGNEQRSNAPHHSQKFYAYSILQKYLSISTKVSMEAFFARAFLSNFKLMQSWILVTVGRRLIPISILKTTNDPMKHLANKKTLRLIYSKFESQKKKIVAVLDSLAFSGPQGLKNSKSVLNSFFWQRHKH